MTIQIHSFLSTFLRCYLLRCKWNLKNWLFKWKLYISFCNLPWSNQVFHEIFQLTVWVPLQWLEEDSKERQHEDQPLKEKQRLSWKDSDFEKVRREIGRRGNVLFISYRSRSIYLRLYICATQIEETSCVAHKFNMFNFIFKKNVYFSDYAKKSPSCWLSPSLVQLCIQLARMELFFSIPETQ